MRFDLPYHRFVLNNGGIHTSYVRDRTNPNDIDKIHSSLGSAYSSTRIADVSCQNGCLLTANIFIFLFGQTDFSPFFVRCVACARTLTFFVDIMIRENGGMRERAKEQRANRNAIGVNTFAFYGKFPELLNAIDIYALEFHFI